MKRIASNVALVIATLSAPSFAAGPYDGVYQYGLSSAFYSVHQNGSQLLIISLSETPASDVNYQIGSYVVAAQTIGNWDYEMGMMVGNTARVSGIGIYGACTSVSDITFENGGATVSLVSSATTPYGATQGINCEQLFRELTAIIGTTITLRKIF